MLPIVIAAVFSAPNVILISVDTLRADHLGFYGYSSPTSPNLDQLATRALVFDDMICEVPLTGPSFCSMMTSQYPRSTGVTRNGVRLPEDVPTVAESFSAAGYETICVTSNWTLKAKLSGLDRGFEEYDDRFREKRWGILKSERAGDEVTRIALELLEARDPERPLFAWFHYSDPHAPYKMHRGFEVTDAKDVPDGRGGQVVVKYDSEIAYTDSLIAEVLAALPSENTYVVFVSDHGESLWEHDYLGHGRRIYQPGLRIPFMISGFDISPGRSDARVRGIDVGPTLLGLAGLDVPPGMQGLDLVHADVPDTRARVIETYGGAVLNVPGAKEIMSNMGPQLQGILIDDWKLVLDGKRTELFRLDRDPGELENLAQLHPELVTRLRKNIQRWSDAVANRMPEEAELSKEDLEALESLGYIE